ncbi:MAG: type II secretion system GspH family protein [Actinomycetota bacterium]|nr:type II secretion system GspH family protein [Actinomycetota bacterium]
MSSPRRLRGEDGVTLAELLTVMAVSSVVMGFITATVVNALGTQRRQTAQVAALNDAKLAFERVTRDIRAADPLRVAALDLIRLDVRDAGGTVRTRTYARDGDRMVVTDAATGQTRSLVGDVATDQPLFLFHLADGSTVTGEGTVDPRSVRSVTVQLRVQPEETGPVVDLQNRVLLRNGES